MPKGQKTNGKGGFGARLAELRKAAGYTQAELGAELGVSQRMIAFYESPEANPPASMLAAMAKALGVSVDVLIGAAPTPKRASGPASSRLERRLKQIEKLGSREKRQILQFLDTFLDREKLRRRLGSGAERTT
jgi:transcriptional regulator with XRE-family HTH domain